MATTRKSSILVPVLARVIAGLVGCGFVGWVAAEAVNNRANDAATNARLQSMQKQIDDLKDHPGAPKWLMDKVAEIDKRKP